ncbi:MAG: type II toxin-antitoxin system RelE/ParE family toxin [Dehalococcoidia bacterium]
MAPFAFLDEAADEVGRAVAWRLSRNPRSAQDLVRAVVEAVDRVRTYPEIGPLMPDGSRHLSISGQPYRLVYRQSGIGVEFIAFAHTSRNPGYRRDRL